MSRPWTDYQRPRGLEILLGLVVLAGCGPAGGPMSVRQSEWAPTAGIQGLRVETEHYDLRVTATDPVLREVLPTFLESTFAEYRRLLPPPPGRPQTLEVYLFETREQWAAFTRRFVPQRAHVYLYIKAGGYVDPETATAVIWDLGRDNTLTLLAHEGFHQYVAKFFPEPVVPWINEGLATQWEAFDLKAGRPVFTSRMNYHRRNSLREALSEPTGWIPLGQLLGMHAGGFGRLLADLGTERIRNNVRAYQAGTPAAAPAGYPEMIFRHYITEDLNTFDGQYRTFCEKLVR
jgi:hypothetical protein